MNPQKRNSRGSKSYDNGSGGTAIPPPTPPLDNSQCQCCGVDTATTNEHGTVLERNGVVCETCQTAFYCGPMCRDWDKWNGGHDKICQPAPPQPEPAVTPAPLVASVKSLANGMFPVASNIIQDDDDDEEDDDDDDDYDDDDVQSMDESNYTEDLSMALSQVHKESLGIASLNAIVEESNVTAELSATDASWRHSNSGVISNASNNSSNYSLLRDEMEANSSSALAFRDGDNSLSSYLQATTSQQQPGSPRSRKGKIAMVTPSLTTPAASVTSQGPDAIATSLRAPLEAIPAAPTDTSPKSLSAPEQATAAAAAATAAAASFTSPSKSSLKSFRESYNVSSDSSSSRSQRKNRSSSLVSLRTKSGSLLPQPELVRGSSLKDFRDVYNAERDDSDMMSHHSDSHHSTGTGAGGGSDQLIRQLSSLSGKAHVGSRGTKDSDEVSTLSSKSISKSNNQEMISVLGDLCVLGGVQQNADAFAPSALASQHQQHGHSRISNNNDGASSGDPAGVAAAQGAAPSSEGLSSLQLARLRNESMRNSLNSALRVYEQLYGEDAAKSVFQKLTTDAASPRATSSTSSPSEQRKTKVEENYDWKRSVPKLGAGSSPSQASSAIPASESTRASEDMAVSLDCVQRPTSIAPSILAVHNAVAPASEFRGASESPQISTAASNARYMQYRASLSTPSKKSRAATSPQREHRVAATPPESTQTKATMSSPQTEVPNLKIDSSDMRTVSTITESTSTSPSDHKASTKTPVRSNKTAWQKPSTSSVLYNEYRESLAKKGVASSMADKALPVSIEPNNRAMASADAPRDTRAEHQSEEKLPFDEVRANASPDDGSGAKLVPRYMDYRASLETNKSKTYAAATPKARTERAPAKKPGQSTASSKFKAASSKEEAIMSSFSSDVLERTNTTEFMEVWNEVEADRSELEAKMAAAKKSAKAVSMAERDADNEPFTALPNNSHLYSQSQSQANNVASTTCLPPRFKKQPSRKDSMDVESGYVSVKGDASENDGESSTYSRRCDRFKLLQYSCLICLLIVAPLAIGFGVAYGNPQRRESQSAADGPDGLATSPGGAPTAAMASLAPTSTYEPVFVPTIPPQSSPTANTQVNDTTSSPTASPSSITSFPVATTTPPTSSPSSIPAAASNPPTAMVSESPTLRASQSPTQSPTTERPTRMPTIIQSEVAEQLFRFLVPVTTDNGASILSFGSPQNLAFEWLASDPNIFTNLTSTRIQQRYALASVYYSTDGNNWLSNLGWLTDADECTWRTQTEESKCDSEGLYSNLNLNGNDLAGILPPELALLTRLETINMQGGPDRNIGGVLPSEIGQLTSLRELDVSGNALFGVVPTHVGSLQSLETLNLNGNKFTNTIPAEINAMTSLRLVSLATNELTGEIPAIGSLTNLETLNLGHNLLSGPIRIESSMPLLKTLQLEKNAFTSIGFDIGRLRMMETFSVWDNQLTGTLATTIGNLMSLKRLSAHTNSLSGPIPPQIGQLVQLEDLNLSGNSLTGAIPSEVGLLVALTNLDLSSNLLVGPLPDELGNLQLAENIKIHENNITGQVSEIMCDAFSNFLPIFQLDCLVRESDQTAEVTCPPGPCCTFCCNDEVGCQCVYENTNFEFLCFEDR